MNFRTTEIPRRIMFCRDVEEQELATKYVARELDPVLEEQFELHLVDCGQCQTLLETLLALREELEARTREIRAEAEVVHERTNAASPVRVCAGAFRSPCSSPASEWYRRWASAATVTSAVALGSLAILSLVKRDSQVAHHVPHGVVATNPPERATPSSVGPASSTSTGQFAAGSAGYGPNDQKGNQQIASAEHAPSSGPAPASGFRAGAERARSNRINEDAGEAQRAPADSVASAVNSIAAQEPPNVASTPPKPNPAASATEASAAQLDNVAVAKELLRLGAIQPPPYTFAGLAGSSGSNNDGSTLSVTPDGGANRFPTTGRTAFKNGMDAYVEKRYDDAVELLDEALKDEPGAPDTNFYLGICLLIKGKPEDSVGPLQTAAANEKSPYRQSAHFFLAKAYLQTADLTRAENEMQIAASTPGYLASEARLLLTRIHALRSPENNSPPGQSKTH